MVGLNWMFTGGTIWVLPHGHVGMGQNETTRNFDRRFWSMFPLARVPVGVPFFDPQPCHFMDFRCMFLGVPFPFGFKETPKALVFFGVPIPYGFQRKAERTWGTPKGRKTHPYEASNQYLGGTRRGERAPNFPQPMSSWGSKYL